MDFSPASAAALLSRHATLWSFMHAIVVTYVLDSCSIYYDLFTLSCAVALATTNQCVTRPMYVLNNKSMTSQPDTVDHEIMFWPAQAL